MNLRFRKATIVTLLVLALYALSLTPLQVASAEDGNIHGYVVDSDGKPIYRVRVRAYDSQGGLASTKYTDSKGLFRMNIAGTYTLVFEKTGYVTLQKTVKVELAPTDDPDLDDVKMGNIAMEKTLSLSSTVVRRVTTPGITLRLSFTVTNNGDLQENVVFSISAPDGWVTRVTDSIGQVESVLLNKGSQSFTLEIRVPDSATDTGVISLTATGTSEASLVFEITPVMSTDDIQLHSTYLSISEEQGKTIELPLTVSNVGEVDKTVSLEAEAPSGWTATFKTSTNLVVRSLYLKPGDSVSMKMVLKPADGAQTGDYEVQVRAVDQMGIPASLVLGVSLIEATSELEVISTFTDVTVTAGSSITFPIAVWNTGEKDALCLLTVPEAPENWKTVFISGDIEVSSLLIAAGESTTVKLRVTPPNSVETGVYVLLASVASDDGAETILPFNVNVAGSYELSLELSTLYRTTTIGEALSFTAKVTNDGQSPVTTAYLDVTLPGDWEATITPAQVSSLAPRASTTFTVEVSTPADTVAGDYLVSVKAYSDQLESSSIDLRVTAQASSTWGYVGFGLVAVAVIGVYFGFRKFKRR
ncbi:hypothetical protein A3K69_06140 [Candidatus Bathyarchaeota archaeon RBG_16_57_9]|nr:MAG: hypothetical protein A3K69_06140 [Candidatus Bathyarchaeota archaeon RBG_16_57_9]OGD53495.1 MAG: hypothetical protein A3K81_03885 [Candidatus Bathyarchaeota archaeon RBG_13_60_20]